MSLQIFDIQRFSVQDGPGIRTTVFLKGCTMRCRWCHNPESLERTENLLYYREKCTGCGLCAFICPVGVHSLENGAHRLKRELCKACRACVNVCPERALEMAGYEIGTAELVSKIMRDREFYESSGGGVTFSGGEPLLQANALKEVLAEGRERGVHTAVETCLNVPWENCESLLSEMDLWICDLKAVTPLLHRQGTGCGNERILENLKKLAERELIRLWVRVPLIPGFNDTKEEAEKIAAFLKKLGPAVQRVEVMAYHDTGRSKYEALGRAYPMGERKSLTKEEAAPFRALLERKIPVSFADGERNEELAVPDNCHKD